MIRFGLSAALLLAASAAPCAAQTATPPNASAPAAGRIVDVSNSDYEFSFGYPAEVMAIPKLKAIMEKEIKDGQSYLAKSAIEAKADSEKNSYPYNPYQSGTVWEVAADTNALLSLSGFYSSYSGGAHGNYGFGARIWDKKAKKLLKNSSDVFTNPKSALELVRQDYCNGLNAARREKLGADWKAEDDGVFSGCPAFADLAIVFRGDKGKPINRIAFIAAPYVAGSYAEGEYEVELPMTAKLVEAVKNGYRGAFVVK
jgi:hypothetical protein